jgi:hypothetical protein
VPVGESALWRSLGGALEMSKASWTKPFIRSGSGIICQSAVIPIGFSWYSSSKHGHGDEVDKIQSASTGPSGIAALSR